MAWSVYVATVAERRAALIDRLGGRCSIPRCRRKDLEIDHPDGRDWQPREVSPWTRISIYEIEALAGKLRLLCRSHNGADGARRRWA